MALIKWLSIIYVVLTVIIVTTLAIFFMIHPPAFNWGPFQPGVTKIVNFWTRP
jgi:hypothetical protein